MTSRYATSPDEVKTLDTKQLRAKFLIEEVFTPNQINTTYSHHDRLIVGGVMPVGQVLLLNCPEQLRAKFFLERREIGFINVGGSGTITVDGTAYHLQFKEALYIGMGSQSVEFKSDKDNQPALFYFNSAPAHCTYPTKHITMAEAEVLELGSLETANHRVINKLIVESVLPTCRLQMGLTELKPGSIWNTLPSHTHDRRMEAYFYFNVQPGQAVCHFMGQTDETRHIWMHNHQAVISPEWSIHTGAGTAAYSFIWGMSGENLDYTDMDACPIVNLK